MTDQTDGTKLCPMCAEEIKAAAVICRYCGSKQQSRLTEADRQGLRDLRHSLALFVLGLPALVLLLLWTLGVAWLWTHEYEGSAMMVAFVGVTVIVGFRHLVGRRTNGATRYLDDIITRITGS